MFKFGSGDELKAKIEEEYSVGGGPAHPHMFKQGGITAYWPGMLLRDYFAAQALAGHCASVPGSHHHPENAARECYAYADAMLAERAKFNR
jgi:hypothetical protein